MITHSADYRQSYTESDTENLSQLLREAVLASPHSAGTLQLVYFKKEHELVTWLWRNRIEGLQLD